MSRTNPNLVCTIAVNMEHCTKYTLEPMQKYAHRVEADFWCTEKTGRRPPHFAKYDLLVGAQQAGYERVLYVDADVYIRRGVPNIFNHYQNALFEETVANSRYPNAIKSITETMQEVKPDFVWDQDYYYNTGVMVYDAEGLDKLCERISARNSQFISVQTFFEQNELNLMLEESGITIQHLNERWNTRTVGREMDSYILRDSYFLHALNLRPKEKREAMLQELTKLFP